MATVVYPKAPFFQSASQDSAYVTVSAGTDVNVYKYNPSTGWGYVGIGNQRGYMLLDHLNKNSYATLTEGASGASVLVLQQELEKRGYFDGTPSGNYSALTRPPSASSTAATRPIRPSSAFRSPTAARARTSPACRRASTTRAIFPRPPAWTATMAAPPPRL